MGEVLTHKQSGEMLGRSFFQIIAPSSFIICHIFDRNDQVTELTKIAAALAIYKCEEGQYPETLDSLAPRIVPMIPTDIFTEKPLQYRLVGKGFLLYSLYYDERDNGATDIYGEIRDGEWQRDQQDVDVENCDLVIRIPVVPRPKP